MNELVELKNNDIFTNTSVIAKGTENEHESVVKTVLTYKEKFLALGKLDFTDLKSGKRGRPIRIYFINEQQAVFLMTLLKNSEIVVNFKFELTKQFFEMRRLLFERQSQYWMETRYQGKLTRKAETDTIKKLVEYARAQGSKNADKLYVVYSKLANSITGVDKRDVATIMQLNNLSVVENIILHCIENGISEGKQYKQIYRDCKKRLEIYNQITFSACQLNVSKITAS